MSRPTSNSAKWWILGVIAVGVLGAFLVLSSEGNAPTATVDPGDETVGEGLFVINCLPCHGDGATGTNSGPPLVHTLYLPDHHPDAAFTLAVRTGVRTHHWQFGHMPAIPGLSDQDISHLIAYVRSLQRAAGLLDDNGG